MSELLQKMEKRARELKVMIVDQVLNFKKNKKNFPHEILKENERKSQGFIRNFFRGSQGNIKE